MMREPASDSHRRESIARSKIFSTFAALTILPAGFNLAVPGTVDGPAWAVAFEVFHGVFIHNVATMLWLFIALMMVIKNTGALRITISADARRYAGLIAFLGVLGFVSTIANVARFSTWPDLGETGRSFLFSFYFLLMSYWTSKHGPCFILRWFLGGIAIGGIVNIYFSVTQPYNFVGVLPFLYNRNGAGGIIALGIALSAWMWTLRDERSITDRVVPIAASLVAIVAVAMSFSKTSMIIGICGVLIWLVVLNESLLKMTRIWYGFALLVAAGAMFIAVPTGVLSTILDSVNESVQNKFSEGLTPAENRSVSDRLSYYVATADILLDNPVNPLLGVGYSGFLPSVIKTKAYREGLAEQEDLTVGKAANPHNSFLYYAIANGVPGLVVVVSLYLMFAKAVFGSVRGPRWLAYSVAAGIAFVYLLYGNALPSLFKTEVMYLPAAAAISARARPRVPA